MINAIKQKYYEDRERERKKKQNDQEKLIEQISTHEQIVAVRAKNIRHFSRRRNVRVSIRIETKQRLSHFSSFDLALSSSSKRICSAFLTRNSFFSFHDTKALNGYTSHRNDITLESVVISNERL